LITLLEKHLRCHPKQEAMQRAIQQHNPSWKKKILSLNRAFVEGVYCPYWENDEQRMTNYL
jgi:hypothetical protein